MKTKKEYEEGEENNKMDLLILPHVVKTVMLTRPKINNVCPIQYSPSLSLSSSHSFNYVQYLLEKIGDVFKFLLKVYTL